MRILFVDNLLLENSRGQYNFDLQPHLGLISLIAVAEGEGHVGLLFDPKLELAKANLALDDHLYRNIAYEIMRFSPDVVGLTTLGCNFICTLKIAGYLKALASDLPILLGGPHATILDRQILERFDQFDVVVRGEAEHTLLPLLDALPSRRLDAIPGISYRRSGEIICNVSPAMIADLDDLPFPAYDHYPINDLQLKILRVEAGRGCPFKCTFCSTASFFGRKYRLKTASRLCAELDQLHEMYGISHFALTHDLFTVNRVKILAFCDAVRSKSYTWTCSARMDCVDQELLESMRDAGCRSIYYGVETGSRRMQPIVEKCLDLDLFHPTIDFTLKLGMTATASFITGYPQEEQSDQDDSLDLIGSCYRRYGENLTVQLHLLTPEPGTKLIRDFGDSMAYDGHITDFNFPTLEPDDSAIMKSNRDIFMNHHYFSTIIPRKRNIDTTSLHHALYRLGFDVLSCLIDQFGGRLSLFFSRMYHWMESLNLMPPITSDMLIRFVAADLGDGHFLVSLLRYMVRVTSASAKRSPSLVSTEYDPEKSRAVFRLSDTCCVLRDVHDCAALLDALKRVKSGELHEVPHELRSRRADYIAVVNSSDQKVVRNFELQSGSAWLLEFFTAPRTFEEFSSFFASVGDDRSARDALDSLCRLEWVNQIFETAS